VAPDDIANLIGECMLQFRTALLVTLVTVAVVPATARSQSQQRRSEPAARRGHLLPNQPNPVESETLIPFRIGADSCVTSDERYVVTLRIYNILSQMVAVPVLVDSTSQGAAAEGESSTALRPVRELHLPCGSYVARWNGRHDRDGRRASPGVYMYQLLVNGHPSGTRKMVVTR
jgi:hypothetical protein